MTEALPATRLSLPVPRQLVLEDFSLYRNRSRIEVSFGDGVFCLAGANGLGKSTFLATLSYAITGVVADPERKFDSLEEYYRYSKPYAASYYRGRIADTDRDYAFVRLVMSVGAREYELERGFFETESLRYLRITDSAGVVLEQDDAQSDGDRSSSYKRHVVRDSGLAHFEQLVFLQNFVLTFDERRRLLLWDDDTIEQALLLAFGVPPGDARRADDLRRRAERAESQARNLQYQATTARQRIADLKARISRSVDDAEGVDYNLVAARRERDEVERQWERLRKDDASAQVAEAESQAAFVAAQVAYEDAFSRLLTPSPSRHPVVRETIEEDACAVCRTLGVAERVNATLDAGACPLCNSKVESPPDIADIDLEGADHRLASARADIAARTAARAELQAELRALETRLKAFDVDLEEASNDDADQLSANAMATLLSQYEGEAKDATVRRNEWRQKRDEFRASLEPIAAELALRYAEAEGLFVPRFVSLAHSFLGLDVQVYLQQRGGRPSLVVGVEGSERRSYDQLSESQRYFLDIALRMALVQHMSTDGSHGCLFVDTPEGSLDISYEARAGRMFADFVQSGCNLVMTANINTSRLLIELAETCGSDKMKIVRMLDWARLSDVQTDGDALFDDALRALESALTSGGGSR